MQKDTLKYALFCAVSYILITSISYYANPQTLFNTFDLAGITFYIILFVFMYLASKKARERKGGFILFGEAFIPAFLVYLISMFIGTVFFYFLVNYYDPSLLEVLKEYQREVVESTAKMMGVSEEQILEAQEREQSDQNPFGLRVIIISFLSSCLLFGLPFASIVAAIVKKKVPEHQA